MSQLWDQEGQHDSVPDYKRKAITYVASIMLSSPGAQQCWYPQDGLISDQRAADQGHAKVPLPLHTYTLSSMSNLNLPDATPLWPDPTPFLGAGTTSQTQLPSPSLKAKNTSVPTKPFTSLISSSSFSIPIFLIILDILDVKI